MSCGFVPLYLLRQIAQHEISQGGPGGRTGGADAGPRRRDPAAAHVRVGGRHRTAWVVHDAHNGLRCRASGALTGRRADRRPRRRRGGRRSGRVARHVQEVYGRDSYDDAGATVVSTVTTSATTTTRSGTASSWSSVTATARPSTGSPSRSTCWPRVTHAVTERTAGLVYEGQSGALNESVPDVFASCLKQRLLGEDAVAGDWLIGAGLFLPGVEGRALRAWRPRNGLRRPRPGQGPAARPHGRLHRHHRRPRRRPSTPAYPTGPSSSRRPRSAGRPRRAPGGSGTPP